MNVNRTKPDRWKSDITESVDMYNNWFIRFAPETYRNSRIKTTRDVEFALKAANNLVNFDASILRDNPAILPTLRMATCPPLAVDRLVGLAGVPANLIKAMERYGRLPPRMSRETVGSGLRKVVGIIKQMLDQDILVWLEQGMEPSEHERNRAATIIADRLCGVVANPIIRNAQEERQLATLSTWLKKRRYTKLPMGQQRKYDAMPPGTFAFRMNIPAEQEENGRQVNISVDAVIMPKASRVGDFPVLVEAKSAGDFTNVNKRRKEEAVKMTQLRKSHGDKVRYILFLCGYFDCGYLGYEAAEGIDWVWEHRIDDLEELGL